MALTMVGIRIRGHHPLVRLGNVRVVARVRYAGLWMEAHLKCSPGHAAFGHRARTPLRVAIQNENGRSKVMGIIGLLVVLILIVLLLRLL